MIAGCRTNSMRTPCELLKLVNLMLSADTRSTAQQSICDVAAVISGAEVTELTHANHTPS